MPQVRQVRVARDAYLVQSDWLSIGSAELIKLGFRERDYSLVCRGTRELILEREISYEEYVGHVRRIVAR